MGASRLAFGKYSVARRAPVAPRAPRASVLDRLRIGTPTHGLRHSVALAAYLGVVALLLGCSREPATEAAASAGQGHPRLWQRDHH